MEKNLNTTTATPDAMAESANTAAATPDAIAVDTSQPLPQTGIPNVQAVPNTAMGAANANNMPVYRPLPTVISYGGYPPADPVYQYRSRGTYIALALILGPLGIHEFYFGYKAHGWWMLILCVLSLGSLGLPLWLWAVVSAFTTNAPKGYYRYGDIFLPQGTSPSVAAAVSLRANKEQLVNHQAQSKRFDFAIFLIVFAVILGISAFLIANIPFIGYYGVYPGILGLLLGGTSVLIYLKKKVQLAVSVMSLLISGWSIYAAMTNFTRTQESIINFGNEIVKGVGDTAKQVGGEFLDSMGDKLDKSELGDTLKTVGDTVKTVNDTVKAVDDTVKSVEKIIN